MDGAQFLAKVRDLSPTIVRLALTGYADIDTAMAAVNENNIFRFLTKPCSKENLLRAVSS
jgi:DNA-binding NtrC family response regulator